MKKSFRFLLVFLLVHFAGFGQIRHSSGSLFKSYKGLVMAGYQGWFNAPSDGAGRGWNHYVSRGNFGPGNCKIDLWPDVTEYANTYPSPFVLPTGQPALLFSSHDASTIDLHFKWMKEYGIDGVFMQRFVADIKRPAGLLHNNTVLKNAFLASEKYKKAISVMYDLSGMQDADYEIVISDWKNLVDSMHVTNRGSKQTYLYHNGKPLVVIWGVGFSDGRKYSLASIEKLVDFFKSDKIYGGCSVMLGVPTYWRDFGNDTEKDPHLHDVLRKADIVHPWFVGRYNETSYPVFQQRIKEDIAWCKANKLDYVPVAFPGFSWHNMASKSPQNQIPRNSGSFFWKQLTGAISSGAEMIYIAMFDEIDEGTAIFKISKQPPEGASNFVKPEPGIPSDYYLFLAGYAGKMLKKKIVFQTEIPSPRTQNSR
jgi:glycoprotein endo-alpha-1,2-mannosidase